MLEGLKEESVGFLFNVQVEAAPAPTVAPVAAPSGLAEFAQAAAKASEQGAAQGGVATKERPAGTESSARPTALQAKGIDNDAPPLTYTGPSEDGSAQVQRSGGGPRHAAPTGTRRERREAARQQAKAAKRRG
jgi:preprotein translocase subunit SecA